MDLRETEEYKMGYAIVTCPICGHETLDSYYICDECGWEYDGIKDEYDHSSANGATPAAYRAAYLQEKAPPEGA